MKLDLLWSPIWYYQKWLDLKIVLLFPVFEENLISASPIQCLTIQRQKYFCCFILLLFDRYEFYFDGDFWFINENIFNDLSIHVFLVM